MASLSYFWPATQTYQCVGAHDTLESVFLFKYPDFILDFNPAMIVSNSPLFVKIKKARLALEATEPEC